MPWLEIPPEDMAVRGMDDDGNAAEPKKAPDKSEVKSEHNLTSGGVEKETLFRVQGLLVKAGICKSTAKLKNPEKIAEVREHNKLLTFEYLRENEIKIENETNPLWYMKPRDMMKLEEVLEMEMAAKA